jgi:hypothetical protein
MKAVHLNNTMTIQARLSKGGRMSERNLVLGTAGQNMSKLARKYDIGASTDT